MKSNTLSAIFLLFVLCIPRASAVVLEMIPVDNAGNAPDTRYNSAMLGSVGYRYQIGKYEITAGQYTEFLNAVAKEDSNGIYNPQMAIPFDEGGARGANIQRSGSSPYYSYTVDPNWADRPVNYVSFWDAARFANWLHNGQPIGPQGPNTTENGAYYGVGNQSFFGRNPNARYWIPSEDEWYKAAYHDKTAGLAARYFDFPTSSNIAPGNDISESSNTGNNANIEINDLTIGSPYYRTLIGEFQSSVSPYGTFDQGGNVYEWNETMFMDVGRGVRGGTLGGGSELLHAAFRIFGDPNGEDYSMGFRVAGIPEPETIMLAILGCAVLGSRRRCKFLSCT